MDAPVRTCWLAVKGAVRSTSFLSAFVGIFQVGFCLKSCVFALSRICTTEIVNFYLALQGGYMSA